MKKTIESYDKIEHGQSSYPQHQISLEDIKIPTAPPACLVLAVNVQVRVMSHAFALKRESIDLQIMTRRCVEEKALVEDDIKKLHKQDTRKILANFSQIDSCVVAVMYTSFQFFIDKYFTYYNKVMLGDTFTGQQPCS